MKTCYNSVHLGCGVNSIADENGSVEEQVMHREMMADLLRIITQIPHKESEAIRMHYFDGETFTNISKVLETTPDQVEIYIHRGIYRLRCRSDYFKRSISPKHDVYYPKVKSCSECEHFNVVENNIAKSIKGKTIGRFQMWCMHPNRPIDTLLMYSVYDITSDYDSSAIRTFKTSYNSNCPMADVQKWLQFKNFA